jgi:hypothetical protein
MVASYQPRIPFAARGPGAAVAAGRPCEGGPTVLVLSWTVQSLEGRKSLAGMECVRLCHSLVRDVDTLHSGSESDPDGTRARAAVWAAAAAPCNRPARPSKRRTLPPSRISTRRFPDIPDECFKESSSAVRRRRLGPGLPMARKTAGSEQGPGRATLSCTRGRQVGRGTTAGRESRSPEQLWAS